MSDMLAGQITGLASTLPADGQGASQTPVFSTPTNVVNPQFLAGLSDPTGAAGALAQTLQDAGLGDLIGWAMDQIKSGATPEEVTMNVRQQPEWQNRFWMIVARQKAGLPPISETDVINYENTAAQLAQNYGMPNGFIDKQTVGQFIADDKSVTELESRLKNGYAQVATADPMVRAAFQMYYGPNGDSNLAAFFTDPDKAEPLLVQQAQAAVLGGNAARYGIGLDQTHAMQLAQAGVTLSSAETGYQDINRLASLFQTDVGDTGPGLDKAAGVDARLLGNAGELDAEQQKLASRAAGAQGKVGVEENPQKGFEGLGASF